MLLSSNGFAISLQAFVFHLNYSLYKREKSGREVPHCANVIILYAARQLWRL